VTRLVVTEIARIHPRADGGSDVIENAIPVCLDCHAEIESSRSNMGRRFSRAGAAAHPGPVRQVPIADLGRAAGRWLPRSPRYNRVGGFTARTLRAAVFAEADTLEASREVIRDAVRCHFDPGDEPRVLRLHVG
jgi:hypothetical protein